MSPLMFLIWIFIKSLHLISVGSHSEFRVAKIFFINIVVFYQLR